MTGLTDSRQRRITAASSFTIITKQILFTRSWDARAARILGARSAGPQRAPETARFWSSAPPLRRFRFTRQVHGPNARLKECRLPNSCHLLASWLLPCFSRRIVTQQHSRSSGETCTTWRSEAATSAAAGAWSPATRNKRSRRDVVIHQIEQAAAAPPPPPPPA